MKKTAVLFSLIILCFSACISVCAEEDGILWARQLSMQFSQEDRNNGVFTLSATTGMTELYPEEGGYKSYKSVKVVPHIYINTQAPDENYKGPVRVGLRYKTDFDKSSELCRFVMNDTSGKEILVAYCSGEKIEFGTTSSASSKFVSVEAPSGEITEVGAVIDPVNKTVYPAVNGIPIGSIGSFKGFLSSTGRLPAGADTIYYMAQGSSYFHVLEYYIDHGTDVKSDILSIPFSDEPYNKITRNLNFPDSLPNGAILSYESDKPDVIDSDGNVYPGDRDEKVRITIACEYEGQKIKCDVYFIVWEKDKINKYLWLDESDFEHGTTFWSIQTDGGTAASENGKLTFRKDETGYVSASRYFVSNLPKAEYCVEGEEISYESYVSADGTFNGCFITLYGRSGSRLTEYGIDEDTVYCKCFTDKEEKLTLPYAAGSEILIKCKINTYTGEMHLYIDDTELEPGVNKKTLAAGGVCSVNYMFPETFDGVVTIDDAALLARTDNPDLSAAEMDLKNLNIFGAGVKSDMVTRDLKFSRTGGLGSRISYSSDNPLVIDELGFVKRSDTDSNVNISAVAAMGEETAAKSIPVVVKAINPLNLAANAGILASEQNEEYPKENANDDITETSWRTDGQDAWLTIKFDKPTFINKAVICEARLGSGDYGIGDYTVEVSDNNKLWKTVYKDNGIGADKEIRFELCSARYVRLKANTVYGAAISEFKLFYESDCEEALRLDSEEINLDGEYVVSGNIELPCKCKYGSVIVWSSSHPEIIADDGTFVKKPKTDTTVTLTALITNVDSKKTITFKRLVKGTDDSSGGKASKSSGGSGGGIRSSGKVKINEINETNSVTDKPEKIFEDVESDRWSYTYIAKLKEWKIISGDTRNCFRPGDAVTRDEYLKMIMEALKIETKDIGTENPFTDTDENEWNYQYILKAYELGIAKGIDGNHFGTGKSISREDMAVLTLNAINASDVKFADGISMEFTDGASIADYARGAVSKLVSAGLINGSDNCFLPKETLTREQAAKIVYLLYEEANK